MLTRFEIIGHDSPRPDADRILFCDGTGGKVFRPETDLELSHWRPNGTPAEYRAGSSTEICFRFLDNPRPGDWTAAVNNHVDVDGMLSVYVLVHSEHARQHRQTIVEAADMGDFWGWGERPAQRLFQGLTFLTQSGGDGRSIYEESFRRIPGLIDGSDPQVAQIEESLAPLQQGIELVQQGQIMRREIASRLVHYIIPRDLVDEESRATYVPVFNEAISPAAILWPQVRNRWDSQRLCLVSVERPAGWFHDLCFPGYLWADTEGKWVVPDFNYHDGMSSYDNRNQPLIDAFERLQNAESGSGQWALGGTFLPFGQELQDRFPLVGRFADEQGDLALSHLRPEQVAGEMKGIFG